MMRASFREGESVGEYGIVRGGGDGAGAQRQQAPGYQDLRTEADAASGVIIVARDAGRGSTRRRPCRTCRVRPVGKSRKSSAALGSTARFPRVLNMLLPW
jgi:hypothetical protein